jgi:hypothetical protein
MIITVVAGGDITMVRGEDALHSKYGRPCRLTAVRDDAHSKCCIENNGIGK